MARNVLWTKRNASLDDGPDVASAFAPVKPLGEGAFGVVLLVRKVLGHGRGSLHAMKIMDKASVDARVLATERQVLEAVCSIDSNFLVKLQYAFQSERRVFLVMDYCAGGHLGALLDGGALERGAARRLGAQLACALRDLHGHGIIHRDLKPENVLLRLDGFVAVADFGLSTLCKGRSSKGPVTRRGAGFAGTVEYAAPERLQKKSGALTAGVDWWAYGAILFECLAGRTPFAAATARDLFINVLFRDPAFDDALADDPFARDLLEGLLLKDPEKRLVPRDARGFATFTSHAFFNSEFDAAVAAPVRDRLDADVAAFEKFATAGADEPACSVQELADKYFTVENGAPSPKNTLAGFEMAACVKMDDEDEGPPVVGSVDGEEVRERPSPPKQKHANAFLFCGCLEKTSDGKKVPAPLTDDDALNRSRSHSRDDDDEDDGHHPGCLPLDAQGLPNFEQAFRDIVDSEGVTVVDGADLREGAAPQSPAGLSAKLADLSGMMFFVCYDQNGDT